MSEKLREAAQQRPDAAPPKELTYAEFNDEWHKNMTEDERQRVREKAQWEHMSLWAILNEWPSLRHQESAHAETARSPEPVAWRWRPKEPRSVPNNNRWTVTTRQSWPTNAEVQALGVIPHPGAGTGETDR